MTLVVSGIGLSSVVSLYAPARWARFGQAGPLFGDDARHFGLAMIVIGLLPLAFFARSQRQAGWIVVVVLVSFWVVVFAPLVAGWASGAR